jgi:hypothetical protein
VYHTDIYSYIVCITQIYSAAVDLILTTGNTVSVYDIFVSSCTVCNKEMSPAVGDLILTAASTVTRTLCVSQNHSGYLA